jgi:hypothetical protein
VERPAKSARWSETLELSGRETNAPFEDPAEVSIVAEADLGGHSLNGPVCGPKEHPGPVDAQAMDVVGRCLVEGGSKRTPEVVRIERKRGGDSSGAQVWLGQVVGDECCRTSRHLDGHSLSNRDGWLVQDLGQYQL